MMITTHARDAHLQQRQETNEDVEQSMMLSIHDVLYNEWRQQILGAGVIVVIVIVSNLHDTPAALS
jgi:hypothetical protein